MSACCGKAEGEKDHLLETGCEEAKIEFVVPSGNLELVKLDAK
jgi:hypothetical protein